MYKKFEMELAGRTLRVDIGRVAKQANGAALMHSVLRRKRKADLTIRPNPWRMYW